MRLALVPCGTGMTMTMMIDHKGKSTVHAILPGQIVRIFELNI